MSSPAEDLRTKFDAFDKDKNGSIDEAEFASLVAALGVKLSAGQIQIAFSAIDVNANGRIDLGEFESWWSKR